MDDDSSVLSAYRRALRHRFDLDIACGGKEALSMLASKGPYAVIVTDMRMPTMNGVAFLARARELAPEAFRIMLTGDTDQETAIQAVNQGNIFRFHTKPCPAPELANSIEAAGLQYKQSQSMATESELLNSENRQLVAQLGDATELANQANRIRTDFLAGINHELRTPLNHIVGFSELMRSEVFGQLDKRYAGYVDHILQSAGHLSTLINTLLQYSTVRSGAVELRAKAIVLERVLERSVTKAKDLVGDNGRVVETEFLSLPGHVTGDECLIEELFSNLISNALKFSKPSDKVVISAKSDAGRCIYVAIQDTGIGIRAEDMDLVQQPFTQVDTGLGRRFEGVGLGLPLAKALAELHGGSLCLESELGVGTTVTVCLPL